MCACALTFFVVMAVIAAVTCVIAVVTYNLVLSQEDDDFHAQVSNPLLSIQCIEGNHCHHQELTCAAL
jgi:uncharacterized BrkB/YihY/UPF0761 family membrane protein